jgi:superfamily II DNA or RNA helicase
MEIIIKSQIQLKNSPPDLNNILISDLKVPNPKFIEADRLGYSTYGIDQYIDNFEMDLNNNLFIPRGYRRKLLSLLKDMKISYTLEDKRTSFPYTDINSTQINYRKYQTAAVIDLVSQDEGLLVAPAGSGKTVMGLSIIPLLGQPTLWLTHTGPLLTQTSARAEKFLPSIKIGTITEGKWNLENILTIGMIQTLILSPKKLASIRDKFGLVILDECQRCPAVTFREIITHLNPYYLYGLTATPYRRDKLETIMFQTLGPPNTTIPIEKVAEHGGIIMPTVKYRAISSKRIDTNNIQTILKEHIVHNTPRNRIIVSDVLKEAVNNNFCIVISDRREHCEILYDLISAGWEHTGIATGKYSKKYVQEQIDRYNKKEITVLVTTFQLLGEGFDVPFINRAFIAMPFRAEGKAVQLIGRIQRSAPGKEDSILYDYVDVNVGVLANQFHNKNSACRCKAYTRLGIIVEPC